MAWLRLGLRDLVLLALTVAVWRRLLPMPEADTPIWLSVLAGASITVCGFLAHEWGHLLGARLAGAVVRPASSLRSVFLFVFDVERSTPRQFLAMSYGGYVASALALAGLAALLSMDRLSTWVALALTGVGVLVTAVLEIPTTVRVHRGRDLPTGFVYVGTPPSRRDAPET